MSETGSPLDYEEQNTRSVSPLSFLLASRCSTPGISTLDGSPRYLFALPPPPPRPRSASPLGMAPKSSRLAKLCHQEPGTELKSFPIYLNGGHGPTEEPPEALSSLEDAPHSHGPESVPSLDDLTQLLRLERYQARKCRQNQHQLHQAQIITARTSRLVHTAQSVQRTLAECIKSEDKDSFANLFNALHDSLDQAESAGEPNDTRTTQDASGVDCAASFVDALPTDSRSAILDFLLKVREDGNFIADRLASLTHKELVSLLPEKGRSRSTESIFGSSPRTSFRMSKPLGFVADGQTDLLSSFEYGSPLETLVLSLRGARVPDLASDPIATDVWATVCARLISQQKPGCETFVPAVIDLWAFSAPWPGKERLRVWISQTLRKGLFLQDQPNRQTFRLRAQAPLESGADEEARSGRYFTDSVDSLLNLLGDQTGATVIPDGARKLCQAICQKLQSSQNHYQAFPNFVLTRWLFPSFLRDAITLPEMHGLMTDQFFTGAMRRQVLHEIAGRAHLTVFNVVYSWRHGNRVSAETTVLVRSVASRFQVSSAIGDTPVVRGTTKFSRSYDEELFIPCSLADINSMVSGLCPRQRQGSISSDFDGARGGLQSSASSISGLSLFQSPESYDSGPRGLGTLSSGPQEPGTMENSAPADPENGVSDDRVDSVLQPEWDSDQLWDACAGMEDPLPDSSSIPGSGCWCMLVRRSDDGLLRTSRDAFLGVSEGDNLSGRTSVEDASELMNRQKCRGAIEDLLLSGDFPPCSTGAVEDITNTLSLTAVGQALKTAFDRRVTDFERDSDFVAAHSWFRKRRNFNAMLAGENGLQNLEALLHDIKQDKEQLLGRSLRLMELCDTWIRSIKPSCEIFGKELLRRSEIASRLRNKMWYVHDVRTSAPYDEARLVTSALKIMGKPRKPPRTRLAPTLRNWSGSRVSNPGALFKTEAQTLEILSTPSDYGGLNKLSDDQAKALSIWMERNAVDNLCAGEERLHRVCMEIGRAVDQLARDDSQLLNNPLFARHNTPGSSQLRPTATNPFLPAQAGHSRFDLLTLQTNVPRSIDSLSSVSSHPLSARSSRDCLDARSPALTNRSSMSFWSPVVTEARSPSSATSIGSSQTHPAAGYQEYQLDSPSKSTNQIVVENLRQHATSLLLSELGNMVFGEGSETDSAFWTGLGGDLTEKHMSSLRQKFALGADDSSFYEHFDFDHVFDTIFRRFEATSNPFTKLGDLLQIDTLLAAYMAQQDDAVLRRTENQLSTLDLHKIRRQDNSQANIKVEGFRRLLCNPAIRPAAVFRDLQYIAALVPATTLESTPQGKAFWNMAVAISSLKQEIRQLMVETADGIISYHSNNRGHGRAASSAQQQRDSATFSVPSRTPSAEDIKRYTMADAAHLLQITAKEGDAVAQRELATLYLTHPELMDHIIAPFSRPREVFKEELESKWRKNQDPNRCDPTTMCVAHHWMSLSSRGGDALAKEFLRQREEMDKLG